MAQQQRLGQLDVVAALDPDPGPQQRRIDLGGRGPDPANVARGLPATNRGGQVGDDLGRTGRAAVRAQGLEQATPVRGLPTALCHHRNQHTDILPVTTDNFSPPMIKPTVGSHLLDAEVLIKFGEACGRAETRRPGCTGINP
jgi:hypothetical protein